MKEELLAKITEGKEKLGRLCYIFQGLRVSDADELTKMGSEFAKQVAEARQYGMLRPYVALQDFGPYTWRNNPERWALCDGELTNRRISSLYDVRPKVIVKFVDHRPQAHVDRYANVTVKNTFNVLIEAPTLRYPYIAAVLNSALGQWWFAQMADKPEMEALQAFPIIAWQRRGMYNRLGIQAITMFGEQMLLLHNDLLHSTSPEMTTEIEEEIDHTRKEIDRLVFELYNIKPAEIKFIRTEIDESVLA